MTDTKAHPQQRRLASGPLAGVTVVDVSAQGPGPFATMVLAAFGADVICVARPGTTPPILDTSYMNGGKRSVQVDMKSDAGRDVIRRLAEHADVLLEGYRPGVMERLGLGPDDLHALNERLVYVRLTGWGQDGPYAQRPGHDINYVAVSGALSLIGLGQPTPPLALLGDFAGGSLMAILGLMLGLRQREENGLGMVVDAAIIDGVSMLVSPFVSLTEVGREQRANLLDGSTPFYSTYRCADGGWFSVGAIEEKFYAGLMQCLGLEDSAAPGWQGQPDRWGELRALMEERFATKTRDEWAVIFEHAETCGAPVLRVDEVEHDPHHHYRGTVVRRHGTLQTAVSPRLSSYGAAPMPAAPVTGRDTTEVLASLGYSEQEIDDMIANGSVSQAPT